MINMKQDYFEQVNSLLRIIGPFINAGVRLPEADIRQVRQIVMKIKQYHAEHDAEALASNPSQLK